MAKRTNKPTIEYEDPESLASFLEPSEVRAVGSCLKEVCGYQRDWLPGRLGRMSSRSWGKDLSEKAKEIVDIWPDGPGGGLQTELVVAVLREVSEGGMLTPEEWQERTGVTTSATAKLKKKVEKLIAQGAVPSVYIKIAGETVKRYRPVEKKK